MDFVNWFVEWFRPAAIYVQLAFDTGWLTQQMQTMPYIAQNVHDRLLAWITDDKEK